MIVEAQGLSKRYGSTVAVDDVSFSVPPGVVTGFLGPNGAGKSTTMRLMLGLDHGSGRTLFGDRPLREHRPVTRVVGVHLDATTFHPKRTARAHLRMLAAEAEIPDRRVDEVVELMGLGPVARKRPGGFSLGMAQRLGLAGAILAEPAVLILDEPANGLDPQSIHWLRDFLRHYAGRGNAVLVSSHLLGEMALMADHIVVIARGRVLADEPLDALVARSARNDVLVRSPERDRLHHSLAAEGITARADGDDGLAVHGADTDRVGDVAFRHGVPLRELTKRTGSLEEAFLELTADHQQFATGGSEPPGPAAPSGGTP